SGTSSRPPASRRHWDRALVVHDLADAGAIRVAKARRIGWQVGPGRHAALHGRSLADLLEPPLEIFEFIDVLALRLPAARPRIADHVGDRVLVAGDIAALVQPVVEHPVEAVCLIREPAGRIVAGAPLPARPAGI